jgi:hypothetical protein
VVTRLAPLVVANHLDQQGSQVFQGKRRLGDTCALDIELQMGDGTAATDELASALADVAEDVSRAWAASRAEWTDCAIAPRARRSA